MNCPRCGNKLRRSTKDPNYGLCDNCRKKYKWLEETAPQKKSSLKNPSNKAVTISALIIGFIILTIVYILTPKKETDTPASSPVYTLINQSDYVRDGEKCQGYRIVASTDITDEEIMAIYSEITSDSKYKYHTLWFYENENDLTTPFATLDDEFKDNDKPSINRGPEQKTEKERLADEQKLAEEASAKEAEKQRLMDEQKEAEEQTAKEAALAAEEERIAQEAMAAQSENDGSGGGNSQEPSGDGSNLNTYDNPEQQQTSASYVLNTSSRKFHYPDCGSVAKIAPQNYATSNSSRDELIAQGYNTCGNCEP